MITGHDLRFQNGTASLSQTSGLGVQLDEAGARLSPWQPMAQPWLDPRLG
jgi:hypothetical protein